MRVLMLGWDFSPRLSGGVGSACRGLANALARAPESLHTEVLFVLPRVHGDEEPESVRLLAGDRAPNAVSPAQAEIPTPPEPSADPVPATAPVSASAPEPAPGPALPTPAEALRLLEIDSPLRPYLSAADYVVVVRELFARIRRALPAPTPVPAALPVGARTAPAATSLPTPAQKPRPAREEAPEGRPAMRVPPYGQTLVAEVERYARSALALAQLEEFDVIHAHDWMTFPAGMLLRERTGKPLVVHFHSSESERRGNKASGEVRAIEQAAIDAAERVLCVSEASARALRGHYAVELPRLRVLHNAFTPTDATDDAHDDAPDEEAGSAHSTVLFLGRLSEQKAPDVFLRAAAAVALRDPSARFVLAGSGELYPELLALAAELGLEDRVQFTGFVAGEDLARTYAGADVYVLSSAAEPFGISALEALSLGVATIIPKGAGVGEVVRSVLRFEPGDSGDLAEKIVALLERPSLRADLVDAGLNEVKKLRWNGPAQTLRGVYDELVPTTS